METPFNSIRLATRDDIDALACLYAEAVCRTAKDLYSPEQIAAWSTFPAKVDAFRAFVFDPETYVIEMDAKPVCFCGLHDDGHIASLYVHPDYNRRGCASTILQHVLNAGAHKGITRFYTEASFLSKAVFERFGFAVDDVAEVAYDGVPFWRFKMVREKTK